MHRPLEVRESDLGAVTVGPLALEQVGDALDVLPREPEAPRNLGDRLRTILERLEYEPAGERLPLGLRERLPGLREELGEADGLDEQARESGAGRRVRSPIVTASCRSVFPG